MTESAQIVIVGGGPVGAALALALAGNGHAPVLLESRTAASPAPGPRPLALSYGSRLILERVNAWERLSGATPIERIHVSQQGGFGRVALTTQEAGLPALGYVVDYAGLHAALAEALAACGAELRTGARVTRVKPDAQGAVVEYTRDGAEREIVARLLVVADGGALQNLAGIRQTDYGQSALTAIVNSELPHRNVAYERFTSSGPLALLPCDANLALIWTVESARSQELCEAPAVNFALELQQKFGGRLGALTLAGARAAHPLIFRFANDVALPRVALIGNAAQTLHPVAGQGFNLGLRDAWELAATVVRDGEDAMGSSAMLAAYRTRRQLDRAGAARFTDTLVRLFSNDVAPLRLARGAGLALLGCAPPLRDFVVRRMTFGTRG